MPANRDRKHIRIIKPPTRESYARHPRKITPKAIPSPQNPEEHAKRLISDMANAISLAKQRREALPNPIYGAEPGTYIRFDSPPGVPLALKSLENRQKRVPIEVLSVQSTEGSEKNEEIQSAMVFLPESHSEYFENKFRQYFEEVTPKKGEPKNKGLVERIQEVSLMTLKGLWTDHLQDFPTGEEAVWWEVWLRKRDGGEYARFLEHAGNTEFFVSEQRLHFEDRVIVLAKATPAQLEKALDALDDLAELRGAKQSAAPFDCMSGLEQAEWMEEMAERIVPPDADSPVVCVLDTGVNRGHPLLVPAIRAEDTHSADPTWGTDDHHQWGHGTSMAGLAIFGDLSPHLASSLPIILRHGAESVKVLPRSGDNDPALYGTITAIAANTVEASSPNRQRCFSMAVTVDENDGDGKPTSWSAAIDSLAAGRAFIQHDFGFDYTAEADLTNRRLFILSAGNVSIPIPFQDHHLVKSDLSPIQDPGQSWNALTVGAHTDLATISDPKWKDWTPVAPAGNLSPHSRTSVSFDNQKWPIKPDVVFEGGNLGVNVNSEAESEIPELCQLTTNHKPEERPFALANATSSATAQVARIATMLRTEYPELWPETIRGLIVHSAKWTDSMLSTLGGAPQKVSKTRKESFVRRYGFGVPSFTRAARSATDALTLVIEGVLHPFDNHGRYEDMHLHELPWPKDELAKLGDLAVRLRITLSYFIEPNPGRRGWAKRYSYPSHGLRFHLKRGAEEDLAAFRKRMSADALQENEKKDTLASEADKWFLGSHAMGRGSLHSNIWEGTAAELSERNVIAVHPVSGWWKEQARKGRTAPYALIVSIETPEATEDIWTPVANQVGVPTAINPIEI